MQNWDEIRTAYQVARAGTVSGAADQLGVHHATVIRHIDALEGRLGVKLFQRHARGYTPTEAGEDLLRVAQVTEDQFSQMLSRMKGRGTEVSGELVVTSLVAVGPRITPVLAAFQALYPEVVLRYLTGDRLYRLEYGEAHVAIRAGSPPDQPDNVVQPLVNEAMGLYASQSYIDRHGKPSDDAEFVSHRFVGADDIDNRAPFHRWMARNIPRDRVVWRGNDSRSLEEAVRCGAGIGFLPVQGAARDKALVEVSGPRPEWTSPLWLVTHVDLHRTSKVQALAQFLKDRAKAGTL